MIWAVLALTFARIAPAEMPAQVTVSLPVSASVEGITLEPGGYSMVIEGFDGSSATVKIYREGTSNMRVAAPAKAFTASQPAARNAVKVTVRDGSYLLDKLLLAGETTGLQFRLEKP